MKTVKLKTGETAKYDDNYIKIDVFTGYTKVWTERREEFDNISNDEHHRAESSYYKDCPIFETAVLTDTSRTVNDLIGNASAMEKFVKQMIKYDPDINALINKLPYTFFHPSVVASFEDAISDTYYGDYHELLSQGLKQEEIEEKLGQIYGLIKQSLKSQSQKFNKKREEEIKELNTFNKI